jgi:L-rhamnose isomerase/sugar isomerase
MAYHFARTAGPRAAVLVDTGHHYQSTNIEQIVTWLLHLDALGGFHFNDRKYADDDLTIGSIDPYQVFRIFHEILSAPAEASKDVAYMIDQSHNLKGKIEAMVQSVTTAQELYARAALVDRERLEQLQSEANIVEAEEIFRSAFWTDVRPLVREWREARGLPAEPLRELAESGYVQRVEGERGARNRGSVASYA